MDPFRKILGEVCKRPWMYVGSDDFMTVVGFLRGYDRAIGDLRSDLQETGLAGFQDWLPVHLDSCVKSIWPEIIVREDTGPDKLEALVRLYDEFAADRRIRGLEAIRADYERLKYATFFRNDRTCWCELPLEEQDQWRPGYRRP
jgi:hypothetical protein